MSNVTLMMCNTVGGDIRSDECDSAEKSENTNVEDIKPVCEEITTIKTEVIEECYDYGTLDDVESEDVKPFNASACFQSVTGERSAISPYEQILKNDYYEQHIVWCKEENDFGLSEEDVAANADKKDICDKKQFNCETCGTSFRGKDGLRKHVKIHDIKRQKEVCCPHCNKTYRTDVGLQRHINIHHVCEKYECGLCDYRTGYKYRLKWHEQIKHSDGGKVYKCKYCEHSTHYRANLKSHERTHSNVTLLKCTYRNCVCEQQAVTKKKSCHCDPCQFETAHGNSLTRHVLAKHSAKAERHRCTRCTYSTHFRKYLTDHMRIHANEESPKKYKCEHCDHTTHWKGNLKKHILIHKNEKILKCAYINCKCGCVEEKSCDCESCDYKTVYESALKGHILRKHSGEKGTYYINRPM